MADPLVVDGGPMPRLLDLGRPAQIMRGCLGSWSPGNGRSRLDPLADGARRNPRAMTKRCLVLAQSDCHRDHRRRVCQAPNTSPGLSRPGPGRAGARHVHNVAMWPA